MDVREFVSHLRVAKGPSADGEYLCRCPAHDDRTASLCVGTGEGVTISGVGVANTVMVSVISTGFQGKKRKTCAQMK